MPGGSFEDTSIERSRLIDAAPYRIVCAHQARCSIRLFPMTTSAAKPASSPNIAEGSGTNPPLKVFALAKTSKLTDPDPAWPARMPNKRRPDAERGLFESAKMDFDPSAKLVPVESNPWKFA